MVEESSPDTINVISKLFSMMPPKEAVSFYQQLLSEFSDLNTFVDKYCLDMEANISIEGRGFPPVAVTLGGLMSIGGVVVSYTVFKNHLKYLITSPQVREGQGFFSLSHQYYEVLRERLEPIILDFNNLPMYGDAEKLLHVLQQGAVILNGVSSELAVWFGRNAGIGRIMIYRPENGRGVYRYV